MNCKICGMGYIPEIPDNVHDHNIYHDKIVNGLTSIQSDDEIVICSKDDLIISVVSNTSAKKLKKNAEEAGIYARKDTDYEAQVLFGELETHVFLLHKENRIIGYMPTDKRDHVWQVSWEDYEANNIKRDQYDIRPIWCICMIWILSKHRRSRYAKLILEKALEYLKCSLNDIAWYVPEVTETGKAFMQSCCPEWFNIAR